nr:hypothetical protein [Tanacetum cinerariifolium]
KYKTARELWAAVLKTFGGNEATKKRKMNLLKQQYGNFKAEGTETLEQTFNRLQVIDMAFISSSKNNSNEDGNTVCVTTASTAFPTGRVNVATISQDTASAYCFSMGHFVRECRAPRSQERGRKESYRQGYKAEEKSSKELMAIDGMGWDWSYMANEEDHALVADG